MYTHWSSWIEDQTSYGQHFLTSNLNCYISSHVELLIQYQTCSRQHLIRNLGNGGCSDTVKLCLKNSLNIGEYDIIEIFNMARRHNIIELIE
jgi:hypothetical protein